MCFLIAGNVHDILLFIGIDDMIAEESGVIFIARYMESVARLQKVQRGLPELLYVLSGFTS